MAREYKLKTWERQRIIKGGSYSQTLAVSNKVMLQMNKESGVVKPNRPIQIPQGIIRYEVIAAYGPATVTIKQEAKNVKL